MVDVHWQASSLRAVGRFREVVATKRKTARGALTRFYVGYGLPTQYRTVATSSACTWTFDIRQAPWFTPNRRNTLFGASASTALLFLSSAFTCMCLV